MAFWANESWIAASATHQYVSGFDPKNLSDGAYKLTLGGEAIVSSGYSESGSEDAYREICQGGVLKLLPGQFAYLITEEKVFLTTDIIGFINAATGVKLKGLVNISGFHVDAGYEGKLIFTVFNAGPTPISIFRGQPLFRFWISDFRGTGSSIKTGYDSIPRDWADRLHGTYPSPFALSARIIELEKSVGKLEGQKNQFLIYAFIIGIFLFPFVAGLYASVFAPWFGATVSERILDTVFKRTPTSGSPLAKEPQEAKPPPAASDQPATKTPPAANTPSTGAKPGE
ncbi:dCTP deaminase domain-containing protein [Methylobacterium marchantiae]|uniref:Deoxycytidine triphosphate deaminase n=1 Tax=Methylobacterium marchantiae TaxID=600331 RepID=A0ABW3X4I0_9HYPH|nr:dCTP deaminase, dUMP-forming [Methylobacterium marchantiae]